MKIGDKVRFLDETGGGVITAFVENDLVTVLTEDGFEFPVLKKDVIVVTTKPEDFEGYSKQEEMIDEPGIHQTIPQEIQKLTLADSLDEKDLKKEQETVRSKTNQSIEEVDLHIRNILPDYYDLSSGEILEVQMAKFTTSLEGAIKHKQKKIVFIHGKGAGKLKYEMQKKLTSDFPGLRFQDASFKEYGYGATLVMIP
jgi:dsDNA-specific endonuclease/ATPase MutS2